ncbi:hypothetical protein Tco_0001795 [Tanacetum coccineum]
MLMCSQEIYRGLKRMKNIMKRGSMNGARKPFHFKSRHTEWPTCNWEEDGYCNEGKLPGMIRGKKEGEESSDDAWNHYSPIDEWEDYEHTTYIETDVNPNQNTFNNVCQIFKDRSGMTNEDAIQSNQEWFDEHEPMEDDDDISDLDDYLITSDAPYHVNEEEKKFKERRSKLLGIPYKKPPTFRSKKFEVIKYSLGPVKEYVAIKEHEYDIWIRTKENVSQVCEEIFLKKDEGWTVTRTK